MRARPAGDQLAPPSRATLNLLERLRAPGHPAAEEPGCAPLHKQRTHSCTLPPRCTADSKLSETRMLQFQWAAHQLANKHFADAVLQHYQDGDIVWVQVGAGAGGQAVLPRII